MVRKMLATTLALGLMANAASAQVSDSEAKARKEAAAARAQAERLVDELKTQQAAMQRKIDALEKELRATRQDSEARRAEAVGKARAEMRKALTARGGGAEGGAKKETYIGVVTEKPSEIVLEQLGLKDGLAIAQVTPKSPAASANLKPHDIILSVNGSSVSSPEQLKKIIINEKGGAKASIVILRGGRKENVTVVLGERDSNKLATLFGEAGEGAKVWAGEPGEGNVFRFRAGDEKGGDVRKKAVEEGRVAAEAARDAARERGEATRERASEARERAAEARARSRTDRDAQRDAERGQGRGEGRGSSNSTSISISNNDGKITIDATITEDGKTTRVNESGSKEDLLKKLDKFPAKTRDAIRNALEGTTSGPAGKSPRVRVEGRVQAFGKDGKPGADVVVRTQDPKLLAELKAQGVDVAKLHDHLKTHLEGGDLAKLHGDLQALHGDGIEALKNLKVHVLDAKTGAIKALDSLNGDEMMKLEGKLQKLEGLKDLKDLKVMKLEDLKGLEGKLEGLKDLDVQVRVLGPENLKDLKVLTDKLPQEIEIQVEKALKDAGLKDKVNKKVIIDRRDSQ